MSPGRIQIRPLGGGPGCLLMILFSIVASVVLTVVLTCWHASRRSDQLSISWQARLEA